MHFVFLLDYSAHGAGLDHAVLVEGALYHLVGPLALELAVRVRLLLMQYLVDDVRLAGPLRNTIVVELRHGRLLPFI